MRITDKYVITCDDDSMRFNFKRISDRFEIPSPLGTHPKSYPVLRDKFYSYSDEKVNEILDIIYTLYYNEDGYEAKMVS